MANTLTGLIPLVYQALHVVSRELVGFIPAVSRNASAERVALNQNVTIPVVPPVTALGDNTPAVTAPDTGDQTMGTLTMAITKSKHAPIRWNGEEIKSVGPNYPSVFRDQVAEGLRALCNAVEADLYAEARRSSSRAYGTPGTTPFGTAADMTDLSNLAMILDDNGAPVTGRRFVGGNAAWNNLRGKQSNLFKVNEAGTADLLRNGVIGRLEGFDMHQSGAVASVAKGTGASATTTNAGHAVGATVINLASAGTGTILAGDKIVITGDANIYTVISGDADVSNGGTITIAEPGLKKAIPTSATNITVQNASASNFGFTPDAMQLLARLPALPPGGDSATDRTTVTDPVSGLTFEFAEYKQYRQVHYEIALAWGVKGTNTRHMAELLG